MPTNYETFATWIQITRHAYKLRDFCDMDTNYETSGDTQHHRVKRLPLSAPTACPTISRRR
jgi:hypothetical protein